MSELYGDIDYIFPHSEWFFLCIVMLLSIQNFVQLALYKLINCYSLDVYNLLVGHFVL